MRRCVKGTRCGRFSVEFRWVAVHFLVKLGDLAVIEVLANSE